MAVLSVLAVLQYRWVGEVSRAERDRLRAGVRARATEFVDAADRDLTRAFAALQLDTAVFEDAPVSALRAALDAAARDSRTGAAVRELFVADTATPGAATLQRLDSATGALEPAEWPGALQPLKARLGAFPPFSVPGVPMVPPFAGDVFDPLAPALVVPLRSRIDLPPAPAPGDAVVMRSLSTRRPSRVVIAMLDRERIREQLVRPLVARVFGDPATSGFDVAVAERATRAVVGGNPAVLSGGSAPDLSMDFFAVRPEELAGAARGGERGKGESASHVRDRVSITILRDTPGGTSPVVTDGNPPWTLHVRATLGSLDAVVAQSRVRNLAVSLGALALLGASVALLLVSSVRSQRTARQQVEFVASVSHELRTPLAVIRSAGENLADGVVTGPQVAQYGALIRDEGRRLTEMVDRVMAFAGLAAGAPMSSRLPVDLLPLVREAASACAVEGHGAGVTIEVNGSEPLPLLTVDSGAIRSALQNVLGNAVKYSHPGGRVRVDVTQAPGRVRVTVRDTGLGVDAEDLPHVFEPFFRGRRAVASQVRGSGVGLSVVKKVIEAHGGRVQVACPAEGGTTVTLDLPVPAGPVEAGA